MVIRGQCIAIGSRIKKDVALQINALTIQLRTLEATLSVKPTRCALRKIVLIRSKLRTLAVGNVKRLLFFLPFVLPPRYTDCRYASAHFAFTSLPFFLCCA